MNKSFESSMKEWFPKFYLVLRCIFGLPMILANTTSQEDIVKADIILLEMLEEIGRNFPEILKLEYYTRLYSSGISK